jgi:hypothetical protein
MCSGDYHEIGKTWHIHVYWPCHYHNYKLSDARRCVA